MNAATRLRAQAEAKIAKAQAELEEVERMSRYDASKRSLKNLAMLFGEAGSARSPIVRTDVLMEIKGCMDEVFAEAKTLIKDETKGIAAKPVLKEVASA